MPTATTISTITSPNVSSARVSVRITLTTFLPPPSVWAVTTSSRTGASPTGLLALPTNATATAVPIAPAIIRRPASHSLVGV